MTRRAFFLLLASMLAVACDAEWSANMDEVPRVVLPGGALRVGEAPVMGGVRRSPGSFLGR